MTGFKFLSAGFVLLQLTGCGLFLSSGDPETDVQRQALLQAVKNPLVYEFQKNLEPVTDCNFPDPETGISPLMYAVMGNEEDQIKALLQKGADPDFVDRQGNSALFYALDLYTETPMQMLLDAGSDINFKGFQGKTPLMEAARLGELDKVKELCQRGADLQIQDDFSRNVLFFAAMARRNPVEILRYLMEEKQLKSNMDNKGDSPLSFAIRHGNTDAALYLIEQIPDLKQNKDAEHFCLQHLKLAIEKNDLPVFRALLAKGPSLDPVPSLTNRFMRVLNINGIYKLAARNHLIKDGKMPLFWAAENDNLVMIQELLNAGAIPTCTDNAGNQPISYAKMRETIKLLEQAEKDYIRKTREQLKKR